VPGHGPQLKKQHCQGQDFAPPIAFQGVWLTTWGAPGLPPVFGLDEAGLIIPPISAPWGRGRGAGGPENPPDKFHLDLEPLREHLLKDEDQSRRCRGLPHPRPWARKITG